MMSRRSKFFRLPGLLLIAVVALVGVVYVLQSRAAGTPLAIEPESGTLSGPASKVANANASGGQVVQFGAAPTPSPTPAAFVHPGVYFNKTQLDFVKAKIAAGQQPWTAGYGKFYSWARGAAPAPDGVTYVGYPNADVTLNCSTNNAMCNSVVSAGIAAYTQSLMYYMKGDRAAGQNAIKTLNAFSSHIKGLTPGDYQSQLVSGWSMENLMRAAEIMRYTYAPGAGEVVFNTAAFTTMLKNIYVPAFTNTGLAATSSNGNWDLSFIDATMSIAVFTDDRALFNTAVSRWRDRTKAYIYLASDGAQPAYPVGGLYSDPAKLKCFWLASSSPTSSCTVPAGFKYTNGQIQEQCRDMGHMVMGMSSVAYSAETAYIQGTNLFAEEKARLTAGFEQSATYYEAYLAGGSTSWPTLPCGQPPTGGIGSGGGFNATLGWVLGYDAYATRLATPMPNTLKMINRFNPAGAANQSSWETLKSGNP